MTFLGLSLLYVLLLAVLVMISALETAIHSVRVVEQPASSEEVPSAERALDRRLRKIRQNPFAQLQRALLLSAAVNLALATLGLYLILNPLREQGMSPWLTGPLLFVVTVLLGDVVPKLYAARRPSEVLRTGSRWLLPVRVLLDPLAAWANRVADAIIRRVVPNRARAKVTMTREEFETLVEMREEQGLLAAEEADMIREVLDLEALTVGDAMVPRVDVPMVSVTDHADQVEPLLERAEGRFVLLHGETPDAVEGVIDVLSWKLAGRPDWKKMVKKPLFVPETMPMLAALRVHLRDLGDAALIVDEYGGLEGLVSQEQVADWLLHEAAPWLGEEVEIREVGEGRYMLDGAARLDDVEEQLNISLRPDEIDGIDTMGGLVLTVLGRVPKAGERINLEYAELKVRRVARARVLEVELRRSLDPVVAAERGGES
ncbi:MAG: DUF21 domain-containing protein [Verrucomicrobiales bacterium]|nr:DUF21 domain-containing protein [Verrucomicrobiales bacterium]